MKDIFREHFQKMFDIYFLRYPNSAFVAVAATMRKVRSDLISDILFKYPQHEPDELADVNKMYEFVRSDCTLEAICYYRIARAIFLKSEKHPALPYLANLMRMRTGIELYYSTSIAPGLNIQHGVGIVIGPRNRIGRNFIIHQGVTIGQRRLGARDESATIGDNVTVSAGAKVLGSVTIGDNAQIGANAVLITDAEPNSVYVGIPAKKVSKADSRIFSGPTRAGVSHRATL